MWISHIKFSFHYPSHGCRPSDIGGQYLQVLNYSSNPSSWTAIEMSAVLVAIFLLEEWCQSLQRLVVGIHYLLFREFMFPSNTNRALPKENASFHRESHRLPILDTICNRVPCFSVLKKSSLNGYNFICVGLEVAFSCGLRLVTLQRDSQPGKRLCVFMCFFFIFQRNNV